MDVRAYEAVQVQSVAEGGEEIAGIFSSDRRAAYRDIIAESVSSGVAVGGDVGDEIPPEADDVIFVVAIVFLLGGSVFLDLLGLYFTPTILSIHFRMNIDRFVKMI